MAPMRRQRGLINLQAYMIRKDISVMSLARATRVHPYVINRALGQAHITMELRTAIEEVFLTMGYKLPRNLWHTADGKDVSKRRKPLLRLDDFTVISVTPWHPVAKARRLAGYLSPQQLDPRKEKKMQPLTLTARRRYGFAFDPFRAEMQTADDVLFTPEHEAALAEMQRAAKRQDFIAIIGDRGCGKSTVAEVFFSRLPGTVHVIKAHTLDKKSLTGSNLYDAIILDIAGELDGGKLSLPAQRERKARKVITLLESLERSDKSAVLVLDECHDLSLDCLKALKRLHELDRAFKRLLGIILIGQLEFNQRLENPTISEVADRIARFEFRGLGKKAGDYCRHKIEAALSGKKMESVLDPEAIPILLERCTRAISTPNGKRIKYGPYPLQCNRMLTMAFNHADELGHSKVTAEDMADITPPKEER